MGMKYQQGTVYPCGKRKKMWYGRYLVYGTNPEGKEVSRERNIALCPRAGVPKWEAEKLLQTVIATENSRVPKSTPQFVQQAQPSMTERTEDPAPNLGASPTLTSTSKAVAKGLTPSPAVSMSSFVKEYYIPLKRGKWSPAYKKTNIYHIEHYLLTRFGEVMLGELSTFDIQTWLNDLAERGYSRSIVNNNFTNIRAITKTARKAKFLAEDPGEDVAVPRTKPVKKPVLTKEQILALLEAIEDLHDLCLLSIGIFCGPRASEAMGLQWKSWTGDSLQPYGTAYNGQFYDGQLKTDGSKNPIPVPERVRPLIDSWRRICPDSSPEALMFPTFGRGERKGKAVPRCAKNFLTRRIRPFARKLGIPDRLVTFQVMRRTLGTDLQKHGTIKDAQTVLRHDDIHTTSNVYIQAIPEQVFNAVNSRTSEVVGNWTPPGTELGLKGRQLKPRKPVRRNSAKFGNEVSDVAQRDIPHSIDSERIVD